MKERIQKLLARSGLGSRRACERLIQAGRITVNGRTAVLGQKADPSCDYIALDETEVSLAGSAPVYIAVHKPAGVLSTTRDDRGRKTVRDLVPLPGHLYLVGRLDLESEGLVLITNDGDLTFRLTHPRYGHLKEYRVLVEGLVAGHELGKWRRGVNLDGTRTAPAIVRVLRRKPDSTWLQVELSEGRKRQIRRVAAILGHPVKRLIRVRIGPVHLGDLQPGCWRPLTKRELGDLRAQTGGRRP